MDFSEFMEVNVNYFECRAGTSIEFRLAFIVGDFFYGLAQPLQACSTADLLKMWVCKVYMEKQLIVIIVTMMKINCFLYRKLDSQWSFSVLFLW